MRKVYLLQIIFLMIGVFAFIPLTIEVFGGMNLDVITICAIVFGAGMIGTFTCAIVRAIQKKKGIDEFRFLRPNINQNRIQ